MSETRLSPLVDPRFNLPQDILWYTFYFVVQLLVDQARNVSEHSALNNLRRLSQVCVSWRELLLASSSLWGMAIEMDKLSQRTCHWRNEVLRRTGNALLDIHCHISTKEIYVLDQFLMSLLDEHWPRIRKLDIKFNEINFNAKGETFMKEAISALEKPAINLESFVVDLGIHSDEIFINSTLFSDQAPVLQEFTWLSYRVKPLRPWFSNLRVLRITCLWTAHELLATLAGMPLLEILEFNEHDEDGVSLLDLAVVGRTSLPRVVLPQLKELDVYMGAALAKHLAVLERLVPAPGLRFRLISGEISLALADLVTVQCVLRSYLQLSFKNELPHDLQISMTSDYILVYLSMDSRKFAFALEFDHDVPDMTTLLEPINFIPLEYSTKLSINIKGVALAATNTTLPSILLSSASIKELHISADSLKLLLSLSVSAHNFRFPVLNLLGLNGQHEVGLVLDFLSLRYMQKAPIQRLHFNDYQHEGSCDFRSLEQLNGLKVRWTGFGGKTKEYTCGNGNAQVLDFSQRFS